MAPEQVNKVVIMIDSSASATRHRPAQYAPSQKWLHWIIAIMVFGLVPVGLVMSWRAEANIFDDLTNALYSGHKITGFTLLWLMALRIVVKVKNGSPAPVATLNKFERIASGAAHHLLYMLLFIVPLSGWAAVSAYGALDVFGLFNLPAILPKNQALATTLFKVHGALAITMTAIVLAHIGGALMHGIVKRDGVITRMIGWWPLK
jgi:cytochrome b561